MFWRDCLVRLCTMLWAMHMSPGRRATKECSGAWWRWMPEQVGRGWWGVIFVGSLVAYRTPQRWLRRMSGNIVVPQLSSHGWCHDFFRSQGANHSMFLVTRICNLGRPLAPSGILRHLGDCLQKDVEILNCSRGWTSGSLYIYIRRLTLYWHGVVKSFPIKCVGGSTMLMLQALLPLMLATSGREGWLDTLVQEWIKMIIRIYKNMKVPAFHSSWQAHSLISLIHRFRSAVSWSLDLGSFCLVWWPRKRLEKGAGW